MRGQFVGGGDFPQAFRQQVYNWVRRIQPKLVLSPSSNCLVSLCAVPQKIQIYIPEKGTTAEFWKPPTSTVAHVLGPFSKWLLAWICRQFVKSFSLFLLYYVEAPSAPQRTTCRGQPCFKVSCKFSEWPSSGPLPPLSPHVYQRSNCREVKAVSAKRQILTARRCFALLWWPFSSPVFASQSCSSPSTTCWLCSLPGACGAWPKQHQIKQLHFHHYQGYVGTSTSHSCLQEYGPCS